jgi:tetratricopeptide (TPR) repeat protein
LPIFIAFTCCLILNAASQLLEDANPPLAATLNPLNTDARINVLVASLNAGAAPLDQLADEARALLAQASADARAYSLVGAIEERRGNEAAAVSSYAAALERSRTERNALTRLLTLSLAGDDVATATRYFDLLLRRWREFAPEIAPLANRFVAHPEGAAALRQALLKDPVWRAAVVRELLASGPGTSFVAELLMTSESRSRRWGDDLAITIANLIRTGQPGEAYALFRQTLADEELALAGYVFDPGFTRPAGRRGFEWAAVNSSTVDASLPAGSSVAGLRIRFLDSPAKLGRPAQTLYLPPGDYQLSSTANGTALVLPKALYWRLGCTGRRDELARLELPEGTYTAKTVTAAFSVPEDCALQSLSIETGIATSSWRDRYGGEILITDVHVSRDEAGA